eukprot:TRINITY_DN3262_c0_g2_i1.p1 TRINITY_DN3262_c0_g2~~TRINITY_DN3262_c0_g2_i1.p1  ORF type:complete len:475 (+),score=98.99 TRINITY_DN3262_c0_g2_i1:92-1516(+)
MSLEGRWKQPNSKIRLLIEFVGPYAEGRINTDNDTIEFRQAIVMNGGKKIKGRYNHDSADLEINLSGDGTNATCSLKGNGPQTFSCIRYKPRPKKVNFQSESWKRLVSGNEKNDSIWVNSKRNDVEAKGYDMHEQPKTGLFSTVAAGYRSPDMKEGAHMTRHKGKRLTAYHRKTGIDGCFSIPAPLYVGCKFEDFGIQRRKAMKERREKCLPERKAFRVQPHQPQLPIFLSEVDKNTPKEIVKSRAGQSRSSRRRNREKNSEVPTKPRNVQTNPPKRGGFGVAGTLFANKGPEAREIIEYASDPYELARERTRRELKAQRDKLEGKPIYRSKPSLREQVSRAAFSKDSEMFDNISCLPEEARGSGFAAVRNMVNTSRSDNTSERPIFKYSNPSPKGRLFGTLSKFPEYISDTPRGDKPQSRPSSARPARPASSMEERKSWFPPEPPKSRPVSSVALNNRNTGAFSMVRDFTKTM